MIGKLPEEMPAWAPEDAIRFPWLNIATVFAYVGGSVAGYLAYANWVAIRRWGINSHPEIEQIRMRAAQSPRIDYLPEDPEGCRRLRRMLSPLHWDISQGAVVLFVVTAAFMISGAATLYNRQSSFQGWRLLTDQAHVWSNISAWLVPVYYGTILAALFGTLTALPEVYARVSQEFLSAIWPRSRWSFGSVRRIFVGVILVESTILIWVGLDFELLTQLAGFLLSNLAVAATAVAAIYLNFKLPPAYRVRRAFLAGAVLSAVVMAVACAASTFGLARKLGEGVAVEKIESRAALGADSGMIDPAREESLYEKGD